MTETHVSFFARLALAIRVLFDPALALRVLRASVAEPALPAPVEPPPLPPREEAPLPDAPPRVSGSLVSRSADGALALLSLLQREGRLVDFLQQDIATFSDGDIGAAARVVHDGCRKSLRSHFDLERVRTEPEGSRVTLEAGFDGAAIQLVGDVRGGAPYRGVLRHSGWRARSVRLPERVASHDPSILAPAEVEL